MEKHRPSFETKKNHLEDSLEKHKSPENIMTNAEVNKKEKDNLVEDARKKAEQVFLHDNEKDTIEVNIEDITQNKNTAETINKKPSKELKEITLNNELKHIQSRLNNIDKTGSKLVHLRGFRSLNEISSRTVTRPFGLLGGGIAAFLGSLMYYFYSNHIGINYNYFMIVVFFVAGYIAGLITEGILRILGFYRD